MIDISQWRASIGHWSSCRPSCSPHSFTLIAENQNKSTKTFRSNDPTLDRPTSEPTARATGPDASPKSTAEVSTKEAAVPISCGDVELNPGPITVEQVRIHIEKSLQKHFASIEKATKHCITNISSELFSKDLISEAVNGSPTYGKIFDEFKAGLLSVTDLSKLIERYETFLGCLSCNGGPTKAVVDSLLIADWKSINKQSEEGLQTFSFPTSSDSEEEIQLAIDLLNESFAELLGKLKEELKDTNVLCIVERLQEYGHKLQFEELKTASNVNELISKLDKYYDFLDCDILKTIATKFATQGLSQALKDHSKAALEFRKSKSVTNLRKFLQEIFSPHIHNLAHAPQAHIHLQDAWTKSPLENLYTLIKCFFPTCDPLALTKVINITCSSVHITYFMTESPEEIEDLILRNREKLAFMKYIGVYEFSINGVAILQNNCDEPFNFDVTFLEAAQAGQVTQFIQRKMSSTENTFFKFSSQETPWQDLHDKNSWFLTESHIKKENDIQLSPQNKEQDDDTFSYGQSPHQESKYLDDNTGKRYHEFCSGKAESPKSLEKKGHHSEPQPSTGSSDKLFDVNPNWLKDGMLNSTIKVKVTPMLLINCGLPNSRKTTALKKLLRAASDLNEEDGIGFCDILAARNVFDNKIVFMPQLQESKGYSLVMYAGVENMTRSSTVKRIRVIRELPSHKFSGFSNQDLNNHFTAVMEDLHKNYLKKLHDKLSEWDQSYTNGLALINVWDLGLNKIPTYVLSHLAGHLYNSHVWMFLDLLRDVDHLYEVPDIPKNQYDKSRNDRELIMRWRSRIRYFVRFAKLASMKGGNRKKVCSIIASCNESTDLEEKLKKLKDAVSNVSKQLQLQDLIDMEKFKVFHNDDIHPLYHLLEKRIKDGLEYHGKEVPLSFMFLRSFFHKKDQLYVMKDELQELSKEFNMDDEMFQEFCRFFTSFGSIIDVSLINPSSKLIILKPVLFLNKLDKLFYYTPGDPIVTSHGFVTKATADAIFNEEDENAVIFMSFLESLHIATKILPNQVNTAIDEWGHYIPNICNRLPLMQCSPTSLHLVHDMNISLSHFKATFTANFLKSYRKAQLDIKGTPHINVTRFCSNSKCLLFELVYLGDIIEFRFPDLDDELLLKVCERIVIECHKIMDESDILYNFAIMCAKNQPQGSCKLHMERHALPFKDECKKCSAFMFSKDGERIKVFSSILTKYVVNEKKKLNGDSFSGEDAVIISKKLSELSAEGAKAVYSEFMGTASDEDWRDWKVFMQMILIWETVNKDAKRQFLSKLESIPFADKPDADKIQEIANSQIKGYYKLQEDASTIKHFKGDSVEKDETLAEIKRQVKSVKDARVHFDYMDNLNLLSDVQIAEKKIFSIQGDKPQLINWEDFGLRIGIEDCSLSPSQTVEVAVIALVGGQFQFPDDTILVSAVYAVSLSIPLPKQIILEIQHCVDLSRQPALSRYLKFAIAPLSHTPSLPYQFSIVEGGEFKPDSWYGSIQSKEFCLVCVLGEESTNGVNGHSDEEDEEVADIPSHSLDFASNESSGLTGASNKPQECIGKGEKMEEEKLEELGKKELDDNEPGLSSGIKKVMTYYGILYFEEDGEEDLLFTFTAARKLNALIEFIKKEHSHAQMRQNLSFCFKNNDGYIELKFNAPQEKPITGWNIQPHIKPSKLNRFDINNFGEIGYPIPPYCLISVYKSTNAVPTLHYAIPLEGVTDPVTLYIHRSSKSSSSVSTATAATEAGARNEGGGGKIGIDVKDASKKLKKVLINHHADLSEIFQYSLVSIANQLLQVGIITREVQKTPTYDSMVGSFISGLSLYYTHSELEEHCIKFLKALSNVGGPVNTAAYMIQKDWTKALNNVLLFKFDI